MATNTVTISDPTMGDLRAMVARANGGGEPAAKPAVSEPVPAPVVEPEKPETVAEPVETKQEPIEKDEPLPEGVQKRIAKEVERANIAQRKIDEAVSTRKAKEAELAKLATTGSEPAPTTEANGRPIKPTWAALSADGKSWADFEQALAKYETDHETWLVAETERTVEKKLTARQAETAAKAKWDEAVKTHGKEFPELMEKAREIAPEGLQTAISSLDNWSAVAVYLAKNPGQLKELSAAYDANPVKAIATLGRIEASLKTAPKAAAEPLPKPPTAVGGGASASSEFDWENASISSLRKQAAKIRGR